MPLLRNVIGVVLSSLIIATASPVTTFAGQDAPPARAETGVTGDSTARLKREIDAILAREFLPVTNAGIKVMSLKKGDTIYEFNPRLLLVPASTQKLFTAAAALSLLGPDREVATTVSLDAAGGRVYLKGCGDSLLSGADLAALAAAAAPRMDRGREYSLAADLSCFDDLYRGKGWMWDDDEMLISPLSVNQNAVSVLVQPGQREGAPAVVKAEPRTSYYTLENLARTGTGKEPSSIKAARRPGERDNVVTVTGVIALGSAPLVKQASVWRPELMALTLFRDALRAQGMKVAGMTTAVTPAGTTVVSRTPRRLEELVRYALKTSDNLTAESLLKLLGSHAGRQPGSGEAGSATVRGYLEREGIATENLVLADGSGLSRYNLSSAETMTRLLRAIHRDPELYRIFQESLPVAGKDGTLKARMKGSCAEGNLRGKTGNMSGVSALSGYASSADGEPLAFSIIIQNYAGSGRQAREVQDRIAALLCGFRRTR
ncbi:MAG TPA: D-alanyl-D-alanine carboxypeptidase/D-alanyl-D-alanine-endopeptidase [Geobacter sp.]|nr:D-alanyl-D-alanine carboxypeptidase/D-alanyl-D-alanine-endopeptidase [Geobacter sp.]